MYRESQGRIMAFRMTKYIVFIKNIHQEERVPLVCRNSSISENTWKGDTKLEEVDLGDYITQIHSGAFADCTSLTTVIFHDSLKRIESNAFVGCTALQKIVLPENLDEVKCCIEAGGVAKLTLSEPTSEELIDFLKQGYTMDLYYKGEFRDDYWD